MFIKYNANPEAARVGDCTVRAIATVLQQDWETTYVDMCDCGLKMHDMPSSNRVWGEYLKKKGYRRYIIPETCSHCYTVRDFANEHKYGEYVLCLNGHVVAVIDGDYIDTWDSGQETPIYYWMKENKHE